MTVHGKGLGKPANEINNGVRPFFVATVNAKLSAVNPGSMDTDEQIPNHIPLPVHACTCYFSEDVAFSEMGLRGLILRQQHNFNMHYVPAYKTIYSIRKNTYVIFQQAYGCLIDSLQPKCMAKASVTHPLLLFLAMKQLKYKDV